MVLRGGPDHLEPLPLQAEVDDTHRLRSRVPHLDRQHMANLVLPVLEDDCAETVVGVGHRGPGGVRGHLHVEGVGRAFVRAGTQHQNRAQADCATTTHVTTE